MKINQLVELDLGNFKTGAEWKAAKDAQKNAGRQAGKQIAMNKQQSATPPAQPGTAVANVPNPLQAQQDRLAQAKQNYEKANPDMAAATKASDLDVQQSQQRANDPSTYQQKPEVNLGKADQVQPDSNVVDVDAKEVPNQKQQDPGAGAFGNIVNQTTNPEPETQASSTGGQITKTPTGQTHTANPNNPNQPTTAAEPAQKQPSGAMSALKKLGGKVASGVGQAIKAAPGAITGAAGSAIGGFAGGLKRGYQQQASGGVAPTWNTPGGGQGGGNDLQQLNARLSAIEKRLSATSEGKLQFESKFLGKKI